MDAAIKSVTLWAAYQHYEEANRGSIEVGKLADFVVLDKNPHTIGIEQLADLKILQTIKGRQDDLHSTIGYASHGV